MENWQSFIPLELGEINWSFFFQDLQNFPQLHNQTASSELDESFTYCIVSV